MYLKIQQEHKDSRNDDDSGLAPQTKSHVSAVPGPHVPTSINLLRDRGEP
jgi:hypothetical protein